MLAIDALPQASGHVHARRLRGSTPLSRDGAKPGAPPPRSWFRGGRGTPDSHSGSLEFRGFDPRRLLFLRDNIPSTKGSPSSCLTRLTAYIPLPSTISPWEMSNHVRARTCKKALFHKALASKLDAPAAWQTTAFFGSAAFSFSQTVFPTMARLHLSQPNAMMMRQACKQKRRRPSTSNYKFNG